MIQPTFDDFVASLVANGEKSGWTSQNATTGAYGKFQILPSNWRNWSKPALSTVQHPWIWAQFLIGRLAIADKVTPPDQWWPNPTETNQTDVARWRLMESWTAHNGDARYVAAMWEGGGGGDPTTWTRRQVLYVNRVCVPIGYDALPVPA